MRRVVVGGRSVEVPVRVSRRARRARIVVDGSGKVEVVVPLRTPPPAVDRLLAEHRGWLERQLAKASRPFALGLQRDDCVWVDRKSVV